jgi:hypothetical protein
VGYSKEIKGVGERKSLKSVSYLTTIIGEWFKK